MYTQVDRLSVAISPLENAVRRYNHIKILT